jgi:hypothetical protein
MLRCLLLAATLMLAACANAPEPVSAALVGKWVAVAPPVGAPPCDEPAWVEYKADGTFRTQSGAQLMSGTYTAVPLAPNRFRVSVTYLQNNGFPNCQGFSPEVVVAHTPSQFYIEAKGKQAQTCPYDDRADFCFQAARRP